MDRYKCSTCGTPWVDHLGIAGTCAKLKEAEERVTVLEECLENFRLLAIAVLGKD